MTKIGEQTLKHGCFFKKTRYVIFVKAFFKKARYVIFVKAFFKKAYIVP